MHPTKILHPTDYSSASDPALREALQLAQEHRADLVLLHVVETLGPEQATYGEMTAPQPETYRRRLWEELHQVLPPDTSVHVEFVLSEEDVVEAILRTATERGCDLIVMGSHGVTGWRKWFSRSVSEEVVGRAGCPVLVVKTPEQGEPLSELESTPSHPGYLLDTDPSGTPPSR